MKITSFLVIAILAMSCQSPLENKGGLITFSVNNNSSEQLKIAVCSPSSEHDFVMDQKFSMTFDPLTKQDSGMIQLTPDSTLAVITNGKFETKVELENRSRKEYLLKINADENGIRVSVTE